MPKMYGEDSIGSWVRWGHHGHKYHYSKGNKASKKRAEHKADAQMIAARANGYKGP